MASLSLRTEEEQNNGMLPARDKFWSKLGDKEPKEDREKEKLKRELCKCYHPSC